MTRATANGNAVHCSDLSECPLPRAGNWGIDFFRQDSTGMPEKDVAKGGASLQAPLPEIPLMWERKPGNGSGRGWFGYVLAGLAGAAFEPTGLVVGCRHLGRDRPLAGRLPRQPGRLSAH